MRTKIKLEGPWPNSVTKKDLEITWFNGKKGGQNVNKHANCCRMKHIPTGIMSQCKDHKSKEQNKQTAFRRLADKLVPIMKALLSTQPKIEKSDEVIRTYKAKSNLVIDKRLDQRFKMDKVLDGDLNEIHN